MAMVMREDLNYICRDPQGQLWRNDKDREGPCEQVRQRQRESEGRKGKVWGERERESEGVWQQKKERVINKSRGSKKQRIRQEGNRERKRQGDKTRKGKNIPKQWTSGLWRARQFCLAMIWLQTNFPSCHIASPSLCAEEEAERSSDLCSSDWSSLSARAAPAPFRWQRRGLTDWSRRGERHKTDKHTHSTTDSSHPFICKAQREREGGRHSGNQEKGEKRRTEGKKETERKRGRETDCGGREGERVRRMVERERERTRDKSLVALSNTVNWRPRR